MRKLNLIFRILTVFIAISCSSDDDDNQNEVVFEKAYLEIGHTTETFCIGDILLTNGTVSRDFNDNRQINSDFTNAIIFNPIDFESCEINYPFIRNFDIQNGDNLTINTMLPPEVTYNAIFDNNGNLTSFNQYYGEHLNITLAQLTVTSSTELNFKIHYENGTILSDSYSGTIEFYDSSN